MSRALSLAKVLVRPPWSVATIVLVVIAVAYVFLSNATPIVIFIATSALITALYAESVSFTTGFAGVPTFGNQLYFGIGAYTAGRLLLTEHVTAILVLLAVGLVLGAATSALSLVLLRGETGFVYGMLTLALGQGVYELVYQTPYFYGEGGIGGLGRGDLAGMSLAPPIIWFWFVLIVVGAAIFGVWLLRRSMFGRVLAATRLSLGRAVSLGVPAQRYKSVAVIVSGALSGLAGVMYAMTYSAVDPVIFYWTAGAQPILAGVLGGMRTLVGPILGAFIYGGTSFQLSQMTNQPGLFVAAGILAVFLIAPSGIVPTVARLVRSRLVRSS